MLSDIFSDLEKRGILAVLEIADPADAVPVARALIDGGISAIELAFRTEAAPQAIKNIANEVPEMLIGAGTLIQKGQAALAKKLGADFGLSPGFNPHIVQEALDAGLPFTPGVATPSDIEGALGLGCRVLKFFPAAPMGGRSYLKSVSAPYRHLGLRFIPLGGVSQETLEDWARDEKVLSVGGTWIAKRNLIEGHQWEIIRENARLASEAWKKARN